MFAADTPVTRKLTASLYPTASLSGIVVNSDAERTLVRWADGGLAYWPTSALSAQRRTLDAATLERWKIADDAAVEFDAMSFDEIVGDARRTTTD